MRQNLTHLNDGHREHRIIRPGRSTYSRARAPCRRQTGGRAIGFDWNQREALSIRCRRPGRINPVSHLEQRCSRCMDQCHPFTPIRQTPLVNAAHRYAGIPPRKSLCIGNQHSQPSGFQPHPQGKRVIDAIHTPNTTEIQSIRAHVLQFDEFKGVTIDAALGSRMVMDLRHSKGVEGLDEGE